jgi:hypothetical protein
MAGATCTNLPLYLNATDRVILESVARIKGLRLSTWIRSAAMEKSREELSRLRER